jgi:uncharacterized protein (TIGR03435 family)
MLDLADFLTTFADRAVRDKTGVKGEFDVRTTGWFDPRMKPATEGVADNREERSDSLGPSLFTVLDEQLRLRLNAQRGPVEVLAIDRAERPTEN